MSVEAMAWALRVEHPSLTPADKLVLIGICNHDGDGGAWPSMATLATYSTVRPRQVRKIIAKLERLGFVTRHVKQGGTHHTPDDRRPNLYVIHREGLEDRSREGLEDRGTIPMNRPLKPRHRLATRSTTRPVDNLTTTQGKDPRFETVAGLIIDKQIAAHGANHRVNPDAYRNTCLNNFIRQHGDRLEEILAKNPDMSPQLAADYLALEIR